jgi:cytochrome c oxidase subunit 1
MSIVAIIVFMAQLLFVINFYYSIFKGRKVQGEYANPWDSNTLEWTAPVERLHGNWPGDIPTVYRWPYDYSIGEHDCNPQNIPLRVGETQH